MSNHHNNTLDKSEKQWFGWTMLLITVAAIGLCLSMAFSSCNTTARLAKIESKHPFQVAEFCASRYPSQDIIHDSISYAQGAILVDTQWVAIDCDSFVNETELHQKTHIVRVPKIVERLRVDTLYQSKTITLKSGAELAQIAILKQQLIKVQSDKNLWEKWAVILGVTLALGIAAKIYFK